MMSLADCVAYGIGRDAHCDGSIADLAAALLQDHSGVEILHLSIGRRSTSKKNKIA
jgi:hypothetical protein